MCDKVLESYEKLTESYKNALKQSLLNFFNESAISVTQSEKLTPFWLSSSVKACDSWILASTKQRIKELVNDIKDLKG